MSVVDDAFKIATKGFDFKKSIDRHRGAYVRRRGEFLHKHNTTWTGDRLATQLKAEIAVVQNYIAGKDPLINDTETKPAKHLELKTAAALVTLSIDNGAFGERFFNGILKDIRTKRIEALAQIVWRAVMVHSDLLWKTLGPPPQLQETALDELLDRRLSAIEQMHITVNTCGFVRDQRPWQVQGPQGPWIDGFRMRPFEYPWVAPANNFKPFLQQMGPDWQVGDNAVHFNPPNQVRVRASPKVTAAWVMDRSKTWIRFRPSSALTPADVIELMFVPRADFWDRSWMFCDHVCSLVNIAALGFALLRRTGNVNAFNEVMNRSGYVNLGPVVSDVHDFDMLMADDTDEYFENTDIAFDDLQVGDFVRFWNSRSYAMLPPYYGAWGSEFSLVMALDVDGSQGKVLRPLSGGPQIWLAGHGVHTQLYNAMAVEATDSLKVRFNEARKIVRGGSTTVVHEGHLYVEWSPYEPLNNAWWVQIPKSTWHDVWRYPTQADVLKAVPRTVVQEAGGSGYNPPPNADAVYFPLFEPVLDQTDADGDSWRSYLRQRKANSSFRLKSANLVELTIDGRLAQGLFYRGSTAKIPVVRPRVRI